MEIARSREQGRSLPPLTHQDAHCHTWHATAFSGPRTPPASPSEHFRKRTREEG